MTLTNALDAFIIDQRLKGNSDKTIQGYNHMLGLFFSWLRSKNIANINMLSLECVKEYQLYINNKPAERRGRDKLTKKTVQTYIRHIKVFLTFCHQEGFIEESLHTKIKMPKAEKTMIEIFTDGEVDKIMATFSDDEISLRNRAIVCLLLDSGLRLSEVTNLQTENINFEKRYIKVVGKGRKERIVPIGNMVRNALQKYYDSRPFVSFSNSSSAFFLSKFGKPLTSAGIGTVMRRLKKATGIKRLHAHLFRHTFATNFLVYGLGDVYELSMILGHCEMKVTEIYLQVASYYTILEKRNRPTYLDMKKDKN